LLLFRSERHGGKGIALTSKQTNCPENASGDVAAYFAPIREAPNGGRAKNAETLQLFAGALSSAVARRHES
jgi:hypothetical protein